MDTSDKFARLKAMGLRHTPNADLRAAWEREITGILVPLGLKAA
jgi:1,2-phenylacetyl-CoA epoxidase catalytic subunit